MAEGGRRRRYDRPPVRYPVETFTAAESDVLSAHCTNLDRPVFALVDLPETLKGALFARYSRYPGTLRRLLLDEFSEDVESAGADSIGKSAGADSSGGKRTHAEQLYERIFLG
jgi:hypothetical protein